MGGTSQHPDTIYILRNTLSLSIEISQAMPVRSASCYIHCKC